MNRQHVELALNHSALAAFRERHPRTRLDLRGANLEEAPLAGDFSGARFDACNLKEASLPRQLRGASFVGARMRLAHLNGGAGGEEEFDRRQACFRGAHMTDCNLRHANFRGADFTGADLRGAFFEGALLEEANFSGCLLKDAHFEGARFGGTLFDAVDLSAVDALDQAVHTAPSRVTLSTLARSGGRIPRSFLAQACADVAIDTIDGVWQAVAEQPVAYRSCFMSYAHGDAPFAERLHRWLRQRGVGVWRDDSALRAGERFGPAIFDAIDRYDHLLLVLSPKSMQSNWVRREIERAQLRDSRQRPQRILPVRIDGPSATPRDAFWQGIFELHAPDFGASSSKLRPAACNALLQSLHYPR